METGRKLLNLKGGNKLLILKKFDFDKGRCVFQC